MGDGGTPKRIGDILDSAFGELRDRVYRPALRDLQDVEGGLIRDLARDLAGKMDPQDSERVARQYATRLRMIYAARAALQDQLLGARDVVLTRVRANGDPK